MARTASSRPRRTAKAILGFYPKDRIDHSVFGLGTILEIDERRTTIRFDEAGTRRFVTSLVKLAPSETPAPTRRKRAQPKKKAARSGGTGSAA